MLHIVQIEFIVHNRLGPYHRAECALSLTLPIWFMSLVNNNFGSDTKNHLSKRANIENMMGCPQHNPVKPCIVFDLYYIFYHLVV